MMAPSASRTEWEAHRSSIEDLYSHQEKSLCQVMKVMEQLHGFSATKKMYKKQIRAWGLGKNVRTHEMKAMIRIEERRRKEGKATHFFLRRKPVNPSKIRRFANRYKLADSEGTADLEPQVATPPEVTYSTPEPSGLTDSMSYAGADDEAGFSSDINEPDVVSPRSFEDSPSIEPMVPSPPQKQSWSSSVGAEWSLDKHHHVEVPASSNFPEEDHSFPYSLPISTQGEETLPIPWIASAEEFYHNSYNYPHYNETFSFNSSSMQQVEFGRGPHVPYFSDDGEIQQPTSEPIANPQSNNFALCATSSSGHGVRFLLDHTPLHDAVINNNVDLVEMMLQGGVNPNSAARGGMTPLHYAAFQRNVELIKVFLLHGANLNAMTDQNRSVLFFSVRSQNDLGSDDMLAYASNTNVGYGNHSDDATRKTITALFDSPAGWKFLLKGINIADKNGVTPLMAAAEGGFKSVVTMFLKRGAHPGTKDCAGHTALKYAASINRRDLVRLLLEADPDVEDRHIDHLLKLANRNFHTRPCTETLQWSCGEHDFNSVLIAEEIARFSWEKGLLDGLLEMAHRRRKTIALELLMAAKRKLYGEEGPAGSVSVETGDRVHS
ncbi:ankyrin repeat-containing domain protein [Podospora australis]|uniref:Ankyrin repeat-containing domain protein n=1 Tax=Podospora australis TaxID=1536484 RepID=A0AAN7AGT5_9PEZI|nr:ankyrin repeat-containing domain protein [Podospora australis]